MNGDWSYWLREHKGTLLAFAGFVVMFTIYAANHPMGLNANVATTAANKGVLLAIVAMAQTLVVLTSGIDLSVGMVMVLANCLASSIAVGSPLATGLGVAGVLLTGCVCGAINGLIVIYGRLQPIVTTIATGAVYYGIALALRPVPGGDVNAALADALTGQLPGGVPASLAVLLILVAVVWLPFRRSAIGRAAYALGSSEIAAYMSGCRSAGRSSSPTRFRVSSRRWQGCSSRLSLIPARLRRPTAAPIRFIRSPPSCWAECRCSAARAARSARYSAR